MCGRYTQRQPWSELATLYALSADAPARNLPPRYNVAPTQDVPIVRRIGDSDARELVSVRWGLVPFWAKDADIGYKMINARAETVERLPSFRAAFRRRRCLIVADGFYEWRRIRGMERKQPYLIHPAGDVPFAFAGLWERWKQPGAKAVESCTIIITTANDFLRPVHDRMPVILTPEHFDDWLDLDRPFDATQALFRPYAGPMTAIPVSTRVNNVRNDDPVCIRPAGPETTGQGRTRISEPEVPAA